MIGQGAAINSFSKKNQELQKWIEEVLESFPVGARKGSETCVNSFAQVHKVSTP